ncbi:MAG: ATP-dependent 6-phosphofructokinase [Polyangia bacterium]
MTAPKTIAISTGGGDCPGLNAVIRAAARTAVLKYGWNVIGIPEGMDGLIWPERARPLTLNDVRGILPRGGTILGTTNKSNPFELHFRDPETGNDTVRDVSDQVVQNARALGIDALINIGGDGTQRIGLKLFHKGLPVVGVPKTIDNDLSCTDSTFGFDTAVHVATDAVDRLHSTAESHRRIMIAEVMGRDAGWIALHAGLAGGAHVILIPEIPFTLASVVESIRLREAGGKRSTVIVLAEGAKLPSDMPGDLVEARKRSRFGVSLGELIGEALGRMSGRDVRVTVLGHTQRGGTPTPLDRILSTRFGVAAVELIAQGKLGHMVALRGAEIVAVSLEAACAQQKLVDPDGELVRVGRSIGVSFGA